MLFSALWFLKFPDLWHGEDCSWLQQTRAALVTKPKFQKKNCIRKWSLVWATGSAPIFYSLKFVFIISDMAGGGYTILTDWQFWWFIDIKFLHQHSNCLQPWQAGCFRLCWTERNQYRLYDLHNCLPMWHDDPMMCPGGKSTLLSLGHFPCI